MGQHDREGDFLAQGHVEPLRCVAVDGNVDRHGLDPFGRGTQILDREGHGDLFVQNGEGWRVADGQAPVPIGVTPGMEQMHGRGHLGRAIKVMHPAIREQDRTGDAATRLFCHRLGQSGHEFRPGIILAIGDGDTPHFGVVAGVQAGVAISSAALRVWAATVRELLTGAFIFDEQHDIAERFAVFLLIDRPRQRGEDHRRRQRPQRPAREAAPERQGDAGSAPYPPAPQSARSAAADRR